MATPKFQVHRFNWGGGGGTCGACEEEHQRSHRRHHSAGGGLMSQSWHSAHSRKTDDSYAYDADDASVLKVPGMRKVLHEPTEQEIADFPLPPGRNALFGVPVLFAGDDRSTGKKKKKFADSAFYSTPDQRYPTIREQVRMAKEVTAQLFDERNKRARGYQMFMQRLGKNEWEHEGIGQGEEDASRLENQENKHATSSEPVRMPWKVKEPLQNRDANNELSLDQITVPIGYLKAVVTRGGGSIAEVAPSASPARRRSQSPIKLMVLDQDFKDGEASARLERQFTYKLARPREFKPVVKPPPQVQLDPVNLNDYKTWKRSDAGLERAKSEPGGLDHTRHLIPRTVYKTAVLPVERGQMSRAELECLRLDSTKKNYHDELAPEVAFSIAKALKRGHSRGSQKFAERRFRSDKFIIDDSNVKRINWRPELDRVPGWLEIGIDELSHLHEGEKDTAALSDISPQRSRHRSAEGRRHVASSWRPVRAPSNLPHGGSAVAVLPPLPPVVISGGSMGAADDLSYAASASITVDEDLTADM